MVLIYLKLLFNAHLSILVNGLTFCEHSDVLGPVADVGVSLASKRNAKLITAIERKTDGILFYTFDFALNDGTHQLLQLCVNKGKIWSLDANTKEKKYSKRKAMYYNILGSFMPKLA
jgi:photosystem II oxygen-evolving enhancer protein 2